MELLGETPAVFFATTSSLDVRPGRRYVGVAAQGRSLKVVLLRTYLALLAAAQRAWDDNGGAKNSANPADPYMTLLGYFSSLRELGGSAIGGARKCRRHAA